MLRMEYERRLLAAAELVLAGDRNPEPPLSSRDLGVEAELKLHQAEGVAWLLRRYQFGVNVVLGDEMGLGKTLQAICLLSYLQIHEISNWPFLILCPLSVTEGWMSEFRRFCPKIRVIQYVGDKEHRRNCRRTMCEHVQKKHSSSTAHELPFDVLLTTYDIALTDQEFLSQIPWDYAVIDEAQRLKNPSSVLYRTLLQHFVIPRRLLLTGTPVQNNLSELWSLMNFCMPSVFGKLEDFLATFKEAGEETGTEKKQLRNLKHVLKAFMLRRTKASLVDSGVLELPPLTELTVMVPLVPLQKKLYLSVLRRELQTLLSFVKGSSVHQSLQNIVMQLRKVCSHPYLFSGIEPEPYVEGEHLVEASGKLIVLDMLLKRLHESGHRVLLFAQMTQNLDILQDFLEFRKYTYERLDGSVRAEERFAAIRSFSLKNEKGDAKSVENHGPFVFMISTRAGGVGLNLVAADTVIFFEQDWNPQADKQALQRAHRIGQLNHVLSVNLVTECSIEEVIMRRAKRKLDLSCSVIGDKDETSGKTAGVGVDAGDMRSLIFGLHIFDPTNINNETFDEETMSKLRAMTNKILELRDSEELEKDERSIEINHTDFMAKKMPDSVNVDPGLDEASYLRWVEKFKDASVESVAADLQNRRPPPEEKERKREADRKKSDEKRLAKWKALGYQSLTVKEPDDALGQHLLQDDGSVHLVYGDCTDPSKFCASDAAIIFSCVDNSGVWGRGGMFNALDGLSSSIADAYHRASEFDDLHMGDLHLIHLDASNCTRCKDEPLWVALAVVQSYNQKRKVPRSGISLPDLEMCISKAASVAEQHSASVHMPRIGYQDGSQRSEWYTVERLLRKYAAVHGVEIFVYYYRRAARNQQGDDSE